MFFTYKNFMFSYFSFYDSVSYFDGKSKLEIKDLKKR